MLPGGRGSAQGALRGHALEEELQIALRGFAMQVPQLRHLAHPQIQAQNSRQEVLRASSHPPQTPAAMRKDWAEQGTEGQGSERVEAGAGAEAGAWAGEGAGGGDGQGQGQGEGEREERGQGQGQRQVQGKAGVRGRGRQAEAGVNSRAGVRSGGMWYRHELVSCREGPAGAECLGSLRAHVQKRWLPAGTPSSFSTSSCTRTRKRDSQGDIGSISVPCMGWCTCSAHVANKCTSGTDPGASIAYAEGMQKQTTIPHQTAGAP